MPTKYLVEDKETVQSEFDLPAKPHAFTTDRNEQTENELTVTLVPAVTSPQDGISVNTIAVSQDLIDDLLYRGAISEVDTTQE